MAAEQKPFACHPSLPIARLARHREAFVNPQSVNYLPFISAFVPLLFSGCATPGSSYAKSHPELPPAHRQILTSGKIPNGDAVSGMTREQVRLAMQSGPTSFDKWNGEDVWAYVDDAPLNSASRNDFSYTPQSSFDNHRTLTETDDFRGSSESHRRTLIFFQGDRATHARVVEDR